MAEAAAADHGNVQAARRCHRSEDERGFVADAAGRMLVYFGRREFGEIEHLAGVQHGVGERGGFRAAKPAQQRRHQPRGDLIVGNFAVRITADEGFDFGARKFEAIALLANHVDRADRPAAEESWSRRSLQAESFRQQLGDREFLPALRALEKDDRLRAEFVNHLAAGAAGRARCVVVVDDGDRLDFHFGPSRATAEKIAVRSAQLVIP